MKKLIASFMVVGFAFAFVACGGGANKEAETTEPAVEEPAAPAVEEEPAAAPDTATVEGDTTAVTPAP